MAGRSKQWLLIGAGAIFGSLSTVALLKILSRTGCRDIGNGLLGFDLEDEVVCNFDLYRLVRVVHTGPSSYRYADRPVAGGSVKNRPSAVDFGR
ncbi:hypothetical protein GW17_00002802 [Ensete ventricosum]|nr:hypothetical protein GW17_00002802 [Ensete ventricosum]